MTLREGIVGMALSDEAGQPVGWDTWQADDIIDGPPGLSPDGSDLSTRPDDSPSRPLELYAQAYTSGLVGRRWPAHAVRRAAEAGGCVPERFSCPPRSMDGRGSELPGVSSRG